MFVSEDSPDCPESVINVRKSSQTNLDPLVINLLEEDTPKNS